jgi:hypothetical protein
MEDKQWYDWMEMWQFVCALAFIVALVTMSNIYRNMLMLLIIVLIAIVIDAVGVGFFRQKDYTSVTGNNQYRRNIKLVLLVIQSFFLALDVTEFILLLAYRYASALGRDEVMERFQLIGKTGEKWTINAILLYLANLNQEKNRQKLLELQKDSKDAVEKLNSLNKKPNNDNVVRNTTNNNTSQLSIAAAAAPPPPPPTSSQIYTTTLFNPPGPSQNTPLTIEYTQPPSLPNQQPGVPSISTGGRTTQHLHIHTSNLDARFNSVMANNEFMLPTTNSKKRGQKNNYEFG